MWFFQILLEKKFVERIAAVLNLKFRGNLFSGHAQIRENFQLSYNMGIPEVNHVLGVICSHPLDMSQEAFSFTIA